MFGDDRHWCPMTPVFSVCQLSVEQDNFSSGENACNSWAEGNNCINLLFQPLGHLFSVDFVFA